MKWYYVEEGSRIGPLSAEEFSGVIDTGKITAETLVWKEGMKEWLAYGELSGISPAVQQEHQVPLSQSGYSSGLRYQGFWIRWVAKIIDGIGVWIIMGILASFLGVFVELINFDLNSDFNPLEFMSQILTFCAFLSIPATYSTLFIGKFDATPGKMLLGMKVVTSDGGKVTYLRALARYFAELLSKFILYIGYLIAAFNDEKAALHDLICDTRVVRR